MQNKGSIYPSAPRKITLYGRHVHHSIQHHDWLLAGLHSRRCLDLPMVSSAQSRPKRLWQTLVQTNIYRIGGLLPALLTLTWDAAKGAIAVSIAHAIHAQGIVPLLVVLACVTGHVFPISSIPRR